MFMNNSSHYDPPSISTCSKSRVLISISFYVIKAIIILPPCSIIIYLTVQRWWQQRSHTSVSHFDVITFHLAATELFWGPGLICLFCGRYSSYNSKTFMLLGYSSFAVSLYGEVLFHLFTCVDRYLAVVHPILYRQMKNSRWVKIRDTSITLVWLLCLGLSSLEGVVTGQQAIILILCFLAFSITVVTFCNVRVLCVLIRPGPGKRGGAKERNFQKQRAFRTITAIWVVLWLWFMPQLIFNSMTESPLISYNVKCVLFPCLSFLNLPISLLLPVLHLYRTRKTRS